MRPFYVFCFLLVVMVFITGYRFRDVVLDAEEILERAENHQIVAPTLNEDSLHQVAVFSETANLDDSYTEKEILQSDTISLKLAANLLKSNIDTFFTNLLHLNQKPLRIIYYGDSQIEGDHVTYSLRKGLQGKFGGKGIGFMPAKMYFNTTHDLAIVTNDFETHSITYSDKTDGPYGLYGKFYSLKGEEGKLRIVNRSGVADFHIFRVFSSGKSNIEIISGSKTVCSKFIDSDDVDITECVFEQTPDEVKVLFHESQNFKLHGISLESEEGILVDNVSFRGNLTLMAHRFDAKLVQQMKAFLNPSLVILHFGLNVIPDNRPDYSDYRAALERDIRFLQKNIPEASFLVISASDMMHKDDGELVVYGNIDDIITAQRQAALNTGAAFWNMQQAMGGPGAIEQWVEKGWARSDYAHLTLEGSNYVGTLLFEDVMKAYQCFTQSDSVRQLKDSVSAELITKKHK